MGRTINLPSTYPPKYPGKHPLNHKPSSEKNKSRDVDGTCLFVGSLKFHPGRTGKDRLFNVVDEWIVKDDVHGWHRWLLCVVVTGG